jgi:hypothetical protein
MTISLTDPFMALATGRKAVAEKCGRLAELFKARQPYHEPGQ